MQQITKSKREQRWDSVFLNVIIFYTFSHSLLVFFKGNFFEKAEQARRFDGKPRCPWSSPKQFSGVDNFWRWVNMLFYLWKQSWELGLIFSFFSFNKDIAQTWKLFSPFPNFEMKWLAIRSGITWGPRIGQVYNVMPGDGRGHHSWRMLPTQSEGSVAAATSSLELSQRRHGNQQAYPYQLVLKNSQGHENLEHNGITWWSYGGEQETTP